MIIDFIIEDLYNYGVMEFTEFFSNPRFQLRNPFFYIYNYPSFTTFSFRIFMMVTIFATIVAASEAAPVYEPSMK